MQPDAQIARLGIDAVALKPSELDLAGPPAVAVESIVIDYEGRRHVPEASTLAALADAYDCRVTVPVRADGFDPLGDDDRLAEIPDAATCVLVAGNPAYLADHEAARAIAPRLRAARERAPDAWIGTEGIERLAIAAGGPQFELLSARTGRVVEGVRTTGFDCPIAVYAPTVLTDDADAILDALGGYLARRDPVRRDLPPDAPTDARATGRVRERLLEAARSYALAGPPPAVRDRIATLRSAGVDDVVAYPARGLDAIR